MDDLKATLIDLLQHDPDLRAELRRAVGTVDTAAILERIDRNTEAIRSLVERIDRNTEAIRQLRVDFQRGMDEHRTEFQKEMRDLRTEFQREMRDLRADFQHETATLNRLVSGLGARWGILAESAFREGMEGVLTTLFPEAAIHKWRKRDEAGTVFGHPAWVEVDLVVTREGEVVLVEVKSSVSQGDVAMLRRIADLYRELEGQTPARLAIVSPFVDPRAERLAATLEIEIYTSTRAV